MTTTDSGDISAANDLALRGELARAERLLHGDSDQVQWLRAYLDAARGRLTAALRRARPLATTAADPEVRAAANRTAASVLRQCGRHREARAFDERALREAYMRAARAHALIGLAADSVGVGARGMCAVALAQAATAAAGDDWRVRVRLDWVRTELGLLTENPQAALRYASDALRCARAASARRHAAKSMLFLGVSQRAAGSPEASRSLREAARIARGLGAVPIARAARSLLDEDFTARSIG